MEQIALKKEEFDEVEILNFNDPGVRSPSSEVVEMWHVPQKLPFDPDSLRGVKKLRIRGELPVRKIPPWIIYMKDLEVLQIDNTNLEYVGKKSFRRLKLLKKLKHVVIRHGMLKDLGYLQDLPLSSLTIEDNYLRSAVDFRNLQVKSLLVIDNH